MGINRLILGIEGGGTHSAWILAEGSGAPIRQGEAGPGNVSLLSDAGIRSLFKKIAKACQARPHAVGAGMAGAVNPTQFLRMERILAEVFPDATTLCAREDSHADFYAAHPDGTGVLLIAGTGSNALASRDGTRWAKAGGWGHIAGDAGSGWSLAHRGCQAAFAHYDRTGSHSALAAELLLAAGCDTMESLASRIAEISGSKTEVAALAPALFRAASRGCRIARGCLAQGADALAASCAMAARKAGLRTPPVALHGGLFEKSVLYRKMVVARLGATMPGSRVALNTTPGAIGALRMVGGATYRHELKRVPDADPDLADAPTEQSFTGGRDLASTPVHHLVSLFLDREEKIVPALRREAQSLARTCSDIARRIAGGGRLIYVGAGTSGRLGVLDASEVPPTFGADAASVQGIIAGGTRALHTTAESAEDDPHAGAAAIRLRAVGRKDIVIGITASGRTPYVLGALKEAEKRRAKTVLLSCNPRAPKPAGLAATTIALPVGPEVVAGSTRLGAGTATKIALNLFSSVAMIKNGHVAGDQMLDVIASNDKLKQRAARILAEANKIPFREAWQRLYDNGWRIRDCLVKKRRKK